MPIVADGAELPGNVIRSGRPGDHFV
jgi:hypothetical protein